MKQLYLLGIKSIGKIMKKLFVVFFLFITLCGCDGGNKHQVDKHRFKLYKTLNIFTSLLLDTKTGQIWQVQYSLDNEHNEGDIPLSAEKCKVGCSNGRFSLSSTGNMWTYLLIDSDTGGIWHCQFTLENRGARGCYPIVNSKS